MESTNALKHNSRTVLILEPNADDRLLLETMATEVCPDINFRFVRDGGEALAYLKGEGPFSERRVHPYPNVFVLNLRLPDMDGFQVLKTIRALQECSGLKVLAWSGEPDPAIAERANKVNVNYFVPGPKPFSFHKLLEEVRRICR